ncbi:MAG TPA: HAD-IA family hydrolase [Candidatus Saccharimonadales bacterium]|nr:HAD-IA family hydrolase [Candidatus Saccharimonadales bacterium]
MIRAVFLDAAHTLIDPDPPSADVYAEVGARHGLRVTPAAMRAALAPLWWTMRAEKNRSSALTGTNEEMERAWWRSLLERAFRDAGEDRALDDACFQEIFGHFAHGAAWRVFPDVRPALEALRGRGLRLGVLSNFDSRLRPVLDEQGLAPYFEAVIISSEVGWEKPHARIYGAALEALGAAPAEALMVGDDWQHDVEGPQAVGMRALWLRRSGAPDPRPSVASLDDVIGHL